MLKEILEDMNESDKKFDKVAFMMDFEDGEMSDKDMVNGFAELTKSGAVWKLQGAYGRVAKLLIDDGIIDKQGNILNKEYL